MTGAPPPAEVEVDEHVVRRLLREQMPDLAHLDIVPVAAGWDNSIFRLGDDYTVRLPRRALAATLLTNEQAWLPFLAPGLPLAVPVPVRCGIPSDGIPWAWSVCRWLPGEPASTATLVDPTAAARALGGFLAALHRPAPDHAPFNPYRGRPLAERSDTFRNELAAAVDDGLLPTLAPALDAATCAAIWQEAIDAPPWAGPPVWVHGDLHPMNLLVHDGEFSAVIDFGDVTAGDPAYDLAGGWMLFDEADLAAFLHAAGAGADRGLQHRARGWALRIALLLGATSAGRPDIERIARTTFRRLAEYGAPHDD